MQRREGGSFRRTLLVLGVLALAWVGVAAFRVGTTPEVTIEPARAAIGKRTPVAVTVAGAGRGLVEVRAELVQGDLVAPLAERSFAPPPAWELWSSGERTARLDLEVGRETIEGLRSGEATLRVTARAAGGWLRSGPSTEVERVLPVRLTPPTLELLSEQHYVAQGGCEAVVYRVGPTAVRDGVEAGGWWFPGFPLPGGGEGQRFAFFAVPYDLDEVSGVRLVAVDEVDNRAETAFIDRFFPKPFRTDTIEVNDAFMGRVVPEILSHTPEIAASGDLLQDYLQINGGLRRQNAERLRELAAASVPELTWRRAFLPLPNGQVMSAFADRRTYVYQGRVVDHQDHLGFDLASLSRAPIPAANDGLVVLAGYFGIYGNAVVIDHGYGLMSLYGHLSSVEVREGQRVARGEVLGRSGQTGLAGGDHLHFTMLLQGLPVNPVEWWDDHWLRDRLARKLGAAMPLEDRP